jgi:hypothetical protein
MKLFVYEIDADHGNEVKKPLDIEGERNRLEITILARWDISTFRLCRVQDAGGSGDCSRLLQQYVLRGCEDQGGDVVSQRYV